MPQTVYCDETYLALVLGLFVLPMSSW